MAFEIPIVLFIYNRPAKTLKVFEEIRKIKPTQLFIVADGSRNSTERLSVTQTRAIAEMVDWSCELQLDFSEINLGCSDRIILGLNKVFEKVDQAIILEDDCLPHPTFFKFCEEMLMKYKDDEQIMHISGFNAMGSSPANASYFFSKYIIPPWGWATWKKAWNHQNLNLDTWQQIKTWAHKNISQEYFVDWTDLFEGARVDRKTWDTSWNVDVWKQKGLGIIPKHSLIQNIGFGEDATFTTIDSSKLSLINSKEMSFPLNHPLSMNCIFEKEIEKEIMESLRLILSKNK